MLIDKAQIITATMMQSKRNNAEADSENELKSSNNQFDDDRQGKLNNWEVKTQIKYFSGKFLNYWMTRTVTTTAYSYTVGCSRQSIPLQMS